MPWKYNSVTIREGRAWTDDNGYQHLLIGHPFGMLKQKLIGA